MSQLFKASFQAFMNKRVPQASASLQADLAKLAKGYIPSKAQNQILMSRMPKSELREVARVECPVQIEVTPHGRARQL